MTGSTGLARGSRRSTPRTSGVITGAVLAAARKSARLTQEDLAELVTVAPDTVRSWETGRRPLSEVRAGDIALIRRRVARLGADPAILGQLSAAIDADAFTTQVINGDCRPLGTEVSTRPWTGLVAWAVGQGAPAGLANGSSTSLLPAAAREAFFGSVRAAAERAGTDEESLLLRHQSYYLAAWDTSADGSRWLADAVRAEMRRIQLDGKWNPGWAVTRSLTVSAACQGDLEPLRWFIRTQLAGQAECEDANLAYWVYWIGADADPAFTEDFMAERRVGFVQALELLRHLAGNLTSTLPYAEISVATITSILRRWPHMLASDPALASSLRDRAAGMLDARWPPATRQELSAIHRAAAEVAQGAHL